MQSIKLVSMVMCLLVSLVVGAQESVFAQETLMYRLYRCDQIGTGTRTDPFRSVLTAYVTEDGTGQGFWDWANYAVPTRYTVVRTGHTTYVAIDGDVRCLALSPELGSVAEVDTWLDTTYDDVGAIAVENDRISLAWRTVSTTRRHIFQFIARHHTLIQDLRGRKIVGGMEMAGAILDRTVSSFPAAQRNGVRNWMIAKGLSTNWITGTTTVRQVWQYVLENMNWPILGLGDVRF